MIKNIREYPIEYGYLIYWHYDINKDNEPNIHKVIVKKIEVNDNTDKLYSNAVKGVEKLKQRLEIPFEADKLNMRKCAGCVVSKYCSHKTRMYQSLSLPYDKEKIVLKFAKFPDELKKTN